MLDRIKRLITPPVFPDDEDKTRQAYLLNVILWGSIATQAIMLAVTWLFTPEERLLLAMSLAYLVGQLVLRDLLGQGRVRLVSYVAIGLSTLAVTGLLAAIGTVLVPAVTAYLTIVMAAGLLLDRRGVGLTLGLNALAITGLVLAESAGLLPRPDLRVGVRQWATLMTMLVYSGLFVNLSTQLVTGSLARARRELAEREAMAARAETLAELSQALAVAGQDARQALDLAVRRCAGLIGDGCSIFLCSKASPFLELAAVHNPDPLARAAFLHHMAAFPLPVNLSGYSQVIQSGQSLLVPEISLEDLIAASTPEYRAYFQAWPVYSLALVPLRARDRVLGVLGLARNSPGRAYTASEMTFLQNIADRVGLTLDNARLYSALEEELAERKRIQADREALISDLEDRNAELERFTYTVSHELKSPLVTIRGFLGYLERDARLGDLDRLNRDIDRIGEAAAQMGRLLDELLELSRIGRRMNPPELVPFEAVAREALDRVEDRLAGRGVRLVIAPGLPAVYGDRVRLVEVVQNLVDNAAKFLGSQPAPCIEIGARQVAGETVFFVQDNGLGIEPRYHARVFGLFEKLDPTSEGTGVGLALVKRIVETHGGRIWVESAGPGQGSTFCFTLPLAG